MAQRRVRHLGDGPDVLDPRATNRFVEAAAGTPEREYSGHMEVDNADWY